MVVKRRTGLLLGGTLLGAAIAVPAFADDSQSQRLQSQIDAMQKQLQQMQGQLTQAKQQAAAAQQAAQSIPSNLYNQAPPIPTKGPAWLSGIHLSLAGSFVEAAGVWRERNEVASGNSDLSQFSQGIPYANSPLYYEHEVRGSAQGSRFAIKADGFIDPAQHLTAYWESDFLGAATTANSRQTNSYTPRIRQAFLEYDNENYHFHVAAGQMWSLITQNKVGELPLDLQSPLVIDSANMVGYNYVRQPAIRFVEDWNKIVWFGVSVEQPEVVFPSSSIGTIGAPTTAVGGSAVPPGLSINDLNVCSNAGGLDNLTSCSTNQIPDFIEKLAVDPGWGHYEVVGLQRFFTDEVAAGTVAAANTPLPAGWASRTAVGWGVGGSVLLPVAPKYAELLGTVLTGQGIGRYGASQLPDVTIGTNGALSPIQATQFLVGAIVHPIPGIFDWYTYYGQEQDNANAWNIGATHGGFGNAAFSENCGTLMSGTSTTGSGPYALNASTACVANVQKVQELTTGIWYNAYKGDLGRLAVGLQYAYFRLSVFPGSTTIPNANTGLNPNNNVVFVSLRYYPFN